MASEYDLQTSRKRSLNPSVLAHLPLRVLFVYVNSIFMRCESSCKVSWNLDVADGAELWRIGEVTIKTK